ncbi:hypothetical protein AeMF1_019500 [Aphanomyces euteiches]|nr:hypothetical protein AeMF1_019500 [Aphanomyces euteiches]
MIARAKGIGFGTVREYTLRIISCLVFLSRREIQWPNNNERRSLAQYHAESHGFRDCILATDGTHVVLHRKPSLYGEVYFSRKKEYSMNVMLTVDPSRQIRHVIVGWPGSVHDSTVWSSSDPYLHPRFYFDPKQYLIGDSGFALSMRMPTPYRLPSSLDPENEIMNNQLSGLRVACEHTNGILKGRWCSLTELPVDIRKVDDINLVCDWILAACVLHNIVNRLRNNRDDVPVYVEKNRKINKPNASNVEGTQEAREWRESIKREVLKFCGV